MSEHISENPEFLVGMKKLQSKAYDDAVSYYKNVLKTNEYHTNVYNNMAMAYDGLNDLQNAIKTYEAGLEKTPHHLKMQVGLGRMLIKEKNFDRARQILENAKDRDPSYALSCFFLSLVYIKEKNYEAALNLLETLDDGSKNAVVFSNQAVIQEVLGDSKKAADFFKLALKHTPNFLNASLGLADNYYRNGWHQEALAEYNKVIEQSTQSSEAYFKMGNIYMKFHEKGKAVECWEKSLALDPENDLLRRNIETVKKLKLA